MMNAGTYYIGDLCYVMHDVWDEVVDLLYPDSNQRALDGEFTLKDGRKFAIYSTAWGDGEYPASNGARICVDSGSVGCILKSDIKDNSYDDETIEQLATFKEFNTPFSTGYYNGLILFGALNVDTDPFDE